MRPDVGTLILLLGPLVAIVAFVIIRKRRKQASRRIPFNQIAQNVRQESMRPHIPITADGGGICSSSDENPAGENPHPLKSIKGAAPPLVSPSQLRSDVPCPLMNLENNETVSHPHLASTINLGATRLFHCVYLSYSSRSGNKHL
jgi:hypothetical protein